MSTSSDAPVVEPASGHRRDRTGGDRAPVSGALGGPDVESLGDALTPDPPPTDVDLVRQLLVGSEDALAALYDRHGPTIFASVVRATGDRWIGAEVVQETFLALWKRAELFDPSRGLLRAWLLTIARNRALDRLRRANRHDRAAAFSSLGGNDEADPSTIDWLTSSGEPVAAARPEPGPEAWLSRKETRVSIADAVTSLAPLERSVIALAYDGGLSQSEIADRLGWPIGTVKTRTRSALRHLRDRLERSEGGVQARGAGVHGENDGARWPRRSRPISPTPIPTRSPCCA